MVDILLNMDLPPSDPQFNAHHHADFIELSTLLRNDLGLLISDMIGLYESEPSASRLENLIELNNNCIGLIRYREVAYSQNLYPFSLENGERLMLKPELDKGHKLYIFLLLCSCTSYLTRSNSSIVRRDFERVSRDILSEYLPENSSCHIMGKTGIQEQRYKGHIIAKLDLLAEDINVSTIYQNHFFAGQNSGDGGLDIVAWSTFRGDTNPKFTQFYVGQCATGRDWVNKQDEPCKLSRYIDTPESMNICLFIPYDGRNSNSTFNQEADILTELVFDRLRLMHIPDNFDFIDNIPAFSIVDEIIETEDDLI